MKCLKAFIGVATINVGIVLEVCMIGISEITLRIGITPNSTNSVLLKIIQVRIVLLSASFSRI